MIEVKDAEMELFNKFKQFSEINEVFKTAFEETEKQIQLSRHHLNEAHAFYVAHELFHVSQHFEQIVEHFSDNLPKVLSSAIFFDDKSYPYNQQKHTLNCILLGKLMTIRTDLSGYALKYFELYPSPFDGDIQNIKKPKLYSNVPILDIDVVESCLSLLKTNAEFYINKWHWSSFIKAYFDHKDIRVKWITYHCLGIVCKMNEHQLESLILSKMTAEEHRHLLCIFSKKLTLREDDDKMTTVQYPGINMSVGRVIQTVDISGIYIPAVPHTVLLPTHLIEVISTCNNLRKIALGLVLNKSICLQGPVGSGKTCLVEHLAAKTGRVLGENFMKIQLGDQTDSKMLLGTYRCTDIPGEFIWQPGVLTQAVLEGSWLLLEDIDSANMDVASVLGGLLENKSLSIPGFRDSVPITPGFQLFFTRRLLSTITGLHKKHSNAMMLLQKHILQVTIDPLLPEELTLILNKQFTEFRYITERLINVFLLFSPKKAEDMEVFSSKAGRLISTRDFFKWCMRAVVGFKPNAQESALKLLQDAIDVFCCSIYDIDEALNLARKISSILGIVTHKADYFFQNYKPSMQLTSDSLIVGRGSIKRDNSRYTKLAKFCFTRPSTVLLERIICCVYSKEPILLVGETGTGKTSTVQYLANTIGQKLIVINMNQQSDSADLLGGFKPVDLKFIMKPIKTEFEHLFGDYFKVEPNRNFLNNIALCYNQERWMDLIKLMSTCHEAALKRLTKSLEDVKRVDSSRKRHASHEHEEHVAKNKKDNDFLNRWKSFGMKLNKIKVQVKQKTAMAFAFIEGSLVKAVHHGHWVLLDEINLANAETLECLSGLLEGSNGTLSLLERGDKQPIKRHPNFTLFACMNPSTDVGKRDLPAGLRNRFTEFFVQELTDKNDLLLLTTCYLDTLGCKDNQLNKIVDFYLKVRRETIASLSDGTGHKPHYSLRSLCRALSVAAKNPCGTFKRSLYEGFCLSFLTQLDSESYSIVESMIARHLIGNEVAVKAVLKQPIPEPSSSKDCTFIQFEGYWVQKGKLDVEIIDNYILTGSVRKNLKDLVRVVSIGKLPVLLQGDTSVGKTSLISYLAKASGNKCVRINNHEHTDLQEYIGSYVADANGKLVFREGLLVEAMRQGHWIILDELNLAPSDVLEALNRVLDDNRELFIPETQQVVKADPNFMLFATQNPPGAYGGRKMMSRAFRNRFVELHFMEIPPQELEFILHKRCSVAPTYAKKMINVMTDLQTRRRGSAAFAGKQGFITLRDLFRWGERYRLAQNSKDLYDWEQHLADEGYLVLAGRVRRNEEKNEIITVLQKHLKREVKPDDLFTLSDNTSPVTVDILKNIYDNRERYKNIVWTFNMRQLAVLVGKALQFKEPVLLVGETGGGKTTVCKLIAENNGQELITVNCHMHTESSDFIGGLRPVRDHSENEKRLFEWLDGPLINAMTQGNVFLADEISLADDSVLERLNSLLEPERTLLVSEKGSDINAESMPELIYAHDNFYFIGTMNPGGDFGKKELSPALRNRFTEIWCETCNDRKDLVDIIEENIRQGVSLGNQQDGSSGIGNNMMDFVEWFKTTSIGKRFTVSIRDILTWVNFINICIDKMEVYEAYLHGAHLTFLDSLGSSVSSSESSKVLETFADSCVSYLKNQIKETNVDVNIFKDLKIEKLDNKFGIKPFYIDFGPEVERRGGFFFNAPTTTFNAFRLLRGMQLQKAILLEGSPGVGKTSLVTAIAKFAGHQVFRINLSDQTDISDLFGADLPVEGGTGGQFSWRDGPLLQALKQGKWILLDELNLASQSVLEGLNACLDHRGEIFIPELGKTFYVKPGTRFFAAQNPLKQGGSRRGLPQSFLNRFIQVYVNSLTQVDLEYILANQFPMIPTKIVSKMVIFNERVRDSLSNHTFGHRGAPWECNLRDLTRWCEAVLYLYSTNSAETKQYQPESLVNSVYGDRMRTSSDKENVKGIFEEVFECKVSGTGPICYVTKERVYVGDVFLNRDLDFSSAGNENVSSNLVLRSQLSVLRSLCYCVNLGWLSILVGSSGSGKSSVVRTLAKLAGKDLKTLPVTSAMDTTDILGGFEQTDYSRHLDKVVKQTEDTVNKCMRVLLADRKDDATKLFELWESYLHVEENKDRTLYEGTKLFMHKITKLEYIWDCLCDLKIVKDNTIEKLREKTKAMSDCVKNEGSLNAGGKFEWVDSVLIKCLVDGSWLLIDNVNLCSSAVLDRLNGLLEPNGILIISERGVDENGRMIEIKPHKDFRLFLTMDPKNGEISRAMRNRGVEIYVLNDHETSSTNEYDTKSLIHLEGLCSKHLSRILMDLHAFLDQLIMGDKPNKNDLMQAAALISQQIYQGTDKETAFYSSILEVYYKTRSPSEFSCNDAHSTIRAEIQKLLNETDKPSDDSDIDWFDTGITLDTERVRLRSEIEKIKQQSSLILSTANSEYYYEYENLLKYFLINYYTITSIEDLPTRYEYLKYALDSKQAINLINLSQEMYDAFDKFNLADKTNETLPQDFRWVPNTIYHNPDRNGANKMILVLSIILQYHNEKTLISKKNRSEVSLLDYMNSRHDKRVEDKFNDVIINEFLTLINTFDANLEIIISQSSDFSNEDVIKIINLLNWRFAFYKCSLVDMKVLSQRYNIRMNLTVHYRWFSKFAIQGIFGILQQNVNSRLQDVLNRINANLDERFPLLYRIGKTYQKYIDKPPPYTRELQLQILSKYSKLHDNLNVNFTEKRILHLSNKRLRTLLIDFKTNLNFDFPDVSDQLNFLLDALNPAEPVTSLNTFEIQLLPVVDYLEQITVRKTINILRNGIPDQNNKGELIPTELVATIAKYINNKDRRLLHELGKLYYNYLLYSANVSPVSYLDYDKEKIEEITLSGHHPKLSYYLSKLLINVDSDNAAITKLGSFREIMNQQNILNLTLWRNMQHLSQKSNDIIYMETEYVKNDFTDFLSEFAESLDVTKDTNDDISSITKKCLDKLDTKMHIHSHGPKDNVNIFKNLIENCVQSISSLTTDTHVNEKINHISSVHFQLGYIKLTMNSKLPLIDPLIKKALKKDYYVKAVDNMRTMETCYNLQNEVYSYTNETIHPHVISIKNSITELTEKHEKLSKYVAVRDKDILYENMLKVIKHGFSSIFSSDYIYECVSTLNNQIQVFLEDNLQNDVNVSDAAKILTQYENSIPSYENLISEWSKYRHSYPDVMEPLLCNCNQFLYGFKLKLSLLNKLLKQHDFLKIGININEVLKSLVKFPYQHESRIDNNSRIGAYRNEGLQNLIHHVLCKGDFPDVKTREQFRLLKCDIEESFNDCLINAKTKGYLDKELYNNFNNLVAAFVNIYNTQQQEKEAKEKEAESLYKTRTKCDDLPEEQQIEKELKQLFPNYHTIDFADMQNTLLPLDDEPNDEEPFTEPNGMEISNEDLKFVVHLHTQLVQNFTKCEWLNPAINKHVTHNFIKPLLQKFKTFKHILERSVHSLDYTIDNNLLCSFNVLLGVAQHYGDTHFLEDQAGSPTRILNKKHHDFYKDPNVEEIKSSYHILEELKNRITKLLDEWPDQPTLKNILAVIERIYDFNIASPISRFLTGFEILLNKCHEWEQVAHSGVSLSQHMETLIHQIIVWRKIELNMWKNLLNSSFERLNESQSKWWMYLYGITLQFTIDKQISVEDLITTLQKFIMQSNIAEFHSRLELLFVFHCHATYLEQNKQSRDFLSILWNLYQYFQQFSLCITNKIKDLRSPIEKKLKDYVKIVKWKDVSYWAVKETVDKSHKILHKYVREFQDVMKQPVSQYLVYTSTINKTENIGIWDRPQRHSLKTHHYTIDPINYMAKKYPSKKICAAEIEKKHNLSKMETYFLKARKLCKEAISTTPYPNLIQNLDGFLIEIIESSEHLQKLEVDTTLPKNKQKSQAKNILQQKHRALADLFKMLSKIGLSFRSGIVETNIRNNSEQFLLGPIDLNASFDHLNYSRNDEKILTIWDSCEIYYTRSLLRFDALETALRTPSKELGVGNIDRCRGFSSQLLQLSQIQKAQLIKTSRTYYYLRFYAQQLSSYCDGTEFLEESILENLRTVITNTLILSDQCKIYLNTCPEDEILNINISQITLIETNINEFIQYKNDHIWSRTYDIFNEVMHVSNKILQTVAKCKDIVPQVENTPVCGNYLTLQDRTSLIDDVSTIITKFETLMSMLTSTPLYENLSHVRNQIVDAKNKIETVQLQSVPETNVENFKRLVENCTNKILIIVQNVYKKYATTVEVQNVEDKSEELPEEENDLKDEHLKSLLIDNLSLDINLMDMQKILKFTEKIAKSLYSFKLPLDSNYKTLMSQYLPLLDQVTLLYQYFITQEVSTFRVTCKLNSILLNIFIELATKGFCIPPEFSEELQGDGISKPSDGLGLGEGEGERDVSDKIESEDQLDDAQPKDQEKEKEEDPNCKEEDKGIEMSEDFDGKLQDKEKNESDEDEDENSNSDADEQMGETGKGADQLDEEIWGSDKEEDNESDGEELGKEEESGNKGEKDGEQQIGAKEKDSKDQPEDDEEGEENGEKNKKDINEMKEPEFDEEQTDPYHGNQPELPEPEPMDLPDDLQLDEGQENENEQIEENPFDIDAAKEQNIPEDKEEENVENDTKQNDEVEQYSSDDEDITKGDQNELEVKDDDEAEDDEGAKKDEDNTEEVDSAEQDQDKEKIESGLDQTQTNEDLVESMEVDNSEATDRTQTNQSVDQKSNQPIDEIHQEDKPEKDGTGQSQMEESKSGHAAQTSQTQELESSKQDLQEEQRKRQKPGESDSKRSLGDVNEPAKKKLKTIDPSEDDKTDKEPRKDEDHAEMFKHIEEAEENATQVLDVATKEQAEAQKREVPNKEDEKADDATEPATELPPEDDSEEEETSELKIEQKAEKVDAQKEKNKNKKSHPDGDVIEDFEEVEVDGENIQTSTVSRGTESSYYTQFENLRPTSATRLTGDEISMLRREVEQQLSSWKEAPGNAEAEHTWQKISSVTSSLAQELSEQLRLVLEPTQASRLKGDYRTGRRINMRKVIPYIASQFRKDKIWLRRTKPHKREYQIVLAIDDSSSMDDNKSKELAFESVAMISKALTLLESGQLAVLSFGETTEVIHKLTDQFTDRSGTKLLQNFKFDQNKTCLAKLVDFATEMFNQSQTLSTALNAKLLVILSDGRGVFSEGETIMRQAIRRGKLADIFTVFVIVDNPANKDSILDIRMPVFKEGKLLGIHNYMDVFPFSFYIILKDIASLPNVLSDALRQWFEIVSNLDKL